MQTMTVTGLADDVLRNANNALSGLLASDVIILRSPMVYGLDDIVREEIELIVEAATHNGGQPRTKLTVLLETTGGYIEIVERIVAVFRRHYVEVDFVIPNFAYSAGTVLALSGDNIYMDYYSVLGPIDPQFQTESGETAPGMGYLAQYRDLLKTIIDAQDPSVVAAELEFLLKKFDPAKLFHIDQAIRHSEDLIKEWLPKYKFKNWSQTETTNRPVDEAYKEQRAGQIAKRLGDAEHWHSHGRGIFMRDLAADDIGLKVDDFGADPNLNGHIRHYYGLFSDYIRGMNADNALHTGVRFRRI